MPRPKVRNNPNYKFAYWCECILCHDRAPFFKGLCGINLVICPCGLKDNRGNFYAPMKMPRRIRAND